MTKRLQPFSPFCAECGELSSQTDTTFIIAERTFPLIQPLATFCIVCWDKGIGPYVDSLVEDRNVMATANAKWRGDS